MRRSILIYTALLLLNIAVAKAQDAPPTACDTYAASPLDPQRKTAGVPEERINPALAIPACLSALQSFSRSPRLKYQLGRAYRKAGNFRDAYTSIRQAAQDGYAIAQAALGNMFEFGEGIRQSYRDAIFWYRKAADQNYAPAQNNLGVMYQGGKGAATNFEQAAIWYRKAADQGFSYSQKYLGALYEQGLGVPKDIAQAIQWYRKAAEQGDPEARAKLAQLGKAELTRKEEEGRQAKEAAKKREEEAARPRADQQSPSPSPTSKQPSGSSPTPQSLPPTDWTFAWILGFIAVIGIWFKWGRELISLVKKYKIRRPVGADGAPLTRHSNFFIRLFRRRIPVRKSFIVLVDEKDRAVRAKTRSCYLINSSALVVFCEKPAVRIDYDIRHDVLNVTTNVEEKQQTERGRTARRMALTGIAAGLLRGGPHPGLAGAGAALLDYRTAGAEKRTIFTGLVHIVFRDLSTIDIRCDRSEFARLCSVLPEEAFSSDRAELADEQFRRAKRMATEGPRVLTELTKNISDLKKEIDAAANACETGASFKERDEARSKLDRMKEQLSIQQVSLRTVRYLVESGDVTG